MPERLCESDQWCGLPAVETCGGCGVRLCARHVYWYSSYLVPICRLCLWRRMQAGGGDRLCLSRPCMS